MALVAPVLRVPLQLTPSSTAATNAISENSEALVAAFYETQNCTHDGTGATNAISENSEGLVAAFYETQNCTHEDRDWTEASNQGDLVIIALTFG